MRWVQLEVAFVIESTQHVRSSRLHVRMSEVRLKVNEFTDFDNQ